MNQEIRTQIDRVWEAFWTGGLSNPLTVIEQMTYLLFIKRLDEIQTQKESKSRVTEMPIEAPIYQPEEYNLRWNRFKELDPQVMFDLFTRNKSPDDTHEKGLFEFLKNIGGRAQVFSKYIKGATFMIPNTAPIGTGS